MPNELELQASKAEAAAWTEISLFLLPSFAFVASFVFHLFLQIFFVILFFFDSSIFEITNFEQKASLINAHQTVANIKEKKCIKPTRNIAFCPIWLSTFFGGFLANRRLNFFDS